MIPLEDNVGDIIGKAQRGLGLSDSELAKKAGADLQAIRKVREGDFDEQCRQVFANIEVALKSQGADFANVVEFTTYLVHSQDIVKFMQFRLREFPRMFPSGRYPPNTLLIVDRLVQEPLLIEVQTVAAL